MIASLDGRIVTDGWSAFAEGRREYERIHETFGADAWMCGRITMEPFAVAIDPSGRLAWQSNEIDGDHVVAVLTERVSDEYLALLRSRGVSYLFAGERDLDLSVALEKLAGMFGVRTLLLEGGGRINGATLRDGLVDEVSPLVAPVADSAIGTPTLFDVEVGHSARRLALVSVERCADDVLWLRYRIA